MVSFLPFSKGKEDELYIGVCVCVCVYYRDVYNSASPASPPPFDVVVKFGTAKRHGTRAMYTLLYYADGRNVNRVSAVYYTLYI